MKMFARIQELVEDPDCLVIVLIDEVESLARARQSSGSGNEPSDSVRVVNALLTQIDQIKRYLLQSSNFFFASLKTKTISFVAAFPMY
jgi:hypothetical protein